MITTNTDIENSARLAYVGCNFYRSGETATGLIHLMSDGRSVTRELSAGSSRYCCAHTDRIAGFRDRVQSHYPGIHIVDTIENSDDEFESYDGTLRLLREHPEINALYFAAGGVYGGCRAVLASGRRDITIISCDKVPTTRDMVLQGVIAATICQRPPHSGHQAFRSDVLLPYHRGKAGKGIPVYDGGHPYPGKHLTYAGCRPESHFQTQLASRTSFQFIPAA